MGTPLRRPPPRRRWLSQARTRVVDEVRLVGLRRVLAVVAAVVVGAGVLWWLLRPAPSPVEARLPFAAPVTGPATAPASAAPAGGGASVVVHVVGEVRRPGLVTLPVGSRVADAVTAAGGPTDEAQIHAVNLAAVVRDGQRLHIPHRQDAEVAAQPVGDPSAAAPGSGFPVDVNQASVEQLLTLPGVGPATAAAIAAHRERHGPFASLDALLDVPGIGPAKLEALRDLATV